MGGSKDQKHDKGVKKEVDFDKLKIILFVIFLIVLAIVCIVNMVILAYMFVVLDISSFGMSSMSFFKDHEHIKWLLDTDLENIIIDGETIGGFSDRNINIQGDQQEVELAAQNYIQSAIKVTPEGTFINTQKFRFVNPKSKKSILNINSGEKVSLVGEFSGKTIKTSGLKTPRIVSDNMNDLTFTSSAMFNLTGNEGLYSDSKSVNVDADENIILQVKDLKHTLELGSLKLNQFILPDSRNDDNVVPSAKRFRLCVCLNTGELFASEVTQNTVTCAIAKENPC